jgi:hypothetical protein
MANIPQPESLRKKSRTLCNKQLNLGKQGPCQIKIKFALWLTYNEEACGLMAFHYWLLGGTVTVVHRFIRLILPVLFGLGKQVLSVKI